ncbi:DUF4012 domain-containing protein [Nocardioides iriomotensis]|uniref:DUF4012 domain-containing protein n=1 Tax=Nocardioides iriomotensis TaxID=715784 RepID=A0A4Q5J4X9_9ACTN|nr:DUF4012 domain-containing protein [Nocardioides iriomotensis]RYU13700.1 DUF4012 domain-containing protein [Nocardioides iriomotensis]
MTSHHGRPHRLRRALLLVGAVVVLAGIAFTAWEAFRARTALQQMAADVETLAGQLTEGDVAAAPATLDHAQAEARTAVDSTTGPGWWLAARLPWVGDDVRAVQVVAGVGRDLTTDALPGVVTSAAALDPARLRPVDGRVDLQPIEDAAPGVVRAAEVIAELRGRADTLDPTALVDQVATPVVDLQTRLEEAAVLADRASRAVRLLPPMLGADGRRTYVLVFQNNAEARATGGIPGAFAQVVADDGRLVLGRQSDAARLGGQPERPVLPLTEREVALFTDRLGRFSQDVNLTPDFPRTGELVRAMWQKRYGTRVDGVLSADPVALSHLLRATGPVDVAGEPVDADSAVPLLLSQVYADVADPAAQNRFFDRVARSVFGAVVTGQGDARGLLDGLVRSTEEGRTLVWSAHPEEQDLLAPTRLGGAFPVADDATPDVGVYLNAVPAYKLDYYLDHRVDVVADRCARGRQHLTVTVRLSSRVPRGYRRLSEYVAPEVPVFGRGAIVQTLYLAVPRDGRLLSMSVDGQALEPQLSSYGDRPVVIRTVALQPGKSREIVLELRTGNGQTGDPDVRTTPGVRSSGLGEVSASACA